MSTRFEVITSNGVSSREETTEDATTAKEEEQVFGERLLDDLMNTFCDKLQRSAQNQKNSIDGLLAIQYITKIRERTFWEWLCCKRLDMESVRKMISGQRKAIQIIYDSERLHYVVLYLNSQRKVVLYDSLNSSDLSAILTDTVKQQIVTLFGHLYPQGEIPVQIELNYERQSDNWSCGYRAVACVTNLARAENPVLHSYDLAAIYRLLIKVLAEKNNNWEVFRNAEFSNGREEDILRVSLLLRFDLNYMVTDGFGLLKKNPSLTNNASPESTRTAKSPGSSFSEEDEKNILENN